MVPHVPCRPVTWDSRAFSHALCCTAPRSSAKGAQVDQEPQDERKRVFMERDSAGCARRGAKCRCLIRGWGLWGRRPNRSLPAAESPRACAGRPEAYGGHARLQEDGVEVLGRKETCIRPPTITGQGERHSKEIYHILKIKCHKIAINSLKTFAEGWSSPFRGGGSVGGRFGGTAPIRDVLGSSVNEEWGGTGLGSQHRPLCVMN